jgi:hypothetical protein
MQTFDVMHDPVTMGELCEAIMSGRVLAVVRDGYYEVKAVEIRGMRRSPEALFATLERLRTDLPLDTGCLDEIGPRGEDIS